MRLNEIARESKSTFKGDKTDLPIVGLEHLIPGELTLTEYDVNTKNTFTKFFRKGQVLFGRRRAYLKKASLAEFDGVCSGDIIVIEPIEGKVYPDLLPFIIQNDRFFAYAVSKSAGGLSPRVKWQDIADYELSLPSLSAQRELSKKLWAAYRLKESYKKLLLATRDMVKSQFIEMFGNHQRIATISDFVDLEILNVKKKYSKGDKILYIDISSIDGNSNQVKSTTEYIVGKEPSRAQQCVQKGDILVSTVRPNKRNIAVIGIENKNLVASTGFCILRSKKGYQEYLLSVVKSDEYTNAMIEKAYGGVYPAVNNSDILSFAVPMPSEYELKRFSDIYIQADKSEFELKKSIEAIDAVIKSLINN